MLVVAGIFTWRYLGTYEDTDDAQVDGHVNAISARISGYVQKVNVDDNQYVKQGAVLVQIDPRDYQVAVEHAKADLADAEATAQALNLNVPVNQRGHHLPGLLLGGGPGHRAGRRVRCAENSSTPRARNCWKREANNARAQADLVRYRALVAKDEVSQQVFDQADATAKANAAAVEQARASVAAAEQQVAGPAAGVAQADAAVQFASTGPQQVEASRKPGRRPRWPRWSRSTRRSIRPN